MKHSRTGILFAALALLGGAACNCATRDATASAEKRSDTRAVVSGTVIDAATGEPLAGVKVIGPHETQCVSGRDGRFVLEGLREGDAGSISATAADGRSAKQDLRPLHPGGLEVVLRLSQR